MSGFIIGRGRYARATYPVRAPMPDIPDASILGVQADAVSGTVTLFEGDGNYFLLPRVQDEDTNPIRAVFTTWTPGSYLRVFARVNWRTFAGGPVGDVRMDVRCIPAVSLDGGLTWAYIDTSASRIDMVVFQDGSNMAVSEKGQEMFAIIGPLAAAPRIGILCVIEAAEESTGGGPDIVQYAKDSETGVNLIAEELAAGIVGTIGPYTLVPIVPDVPPFSP